jgi:hypothetical protein
MLGLVCALLLTADDPHAAANPIYVALRQDGVALGPKTTVPLPAPAMSDGLTAAEQRAVIENLPARQTPAEELLRLSPVAPFVLKIRDVDSGLAQAPGRGIDLYFVAQGRLDDLEKSALLDRLLNSGRQDATIRPLAPAELAGRLPEAMVAQRRRAYAHLEIGLMDRIVLVGTCATTWSRTADSLIVAGRLDPALTDDLQLGNHWRPLERAGDGKLEARGRAQRYDAAGYYLKFTELREPADALFVEWHLVFSEPQAWFGGANLLRSKLPLVLQTKVRAFRRDLARR